MILSTSARRGLLLQRLGEIVSALTQFVEQPRVLDGDDRLRGEVRQKLDLLFGEGTDFLAINGDGADQLVSLSMGTQTLDFAPPSEAALPTQFASAV